MVTTNRTSRVKQVGITAGSLSGPYYDETGYKATGVGQRKVA